MEERPRIRKKSLYRGESVERGKKKRRSFSYIKGFV